MYFTQTIDITLTPENTQGLEQPSKIFNKIKSVLGSGMAPAESRRAVVMLSVLQRLNTAFRDCGITDILRLSVNGARVYSDMEGKDTNDFEKSVDAFVEANKQGEIKTLNHLELVADIQHEGLRFVFNIHLFRQVPRDHSPVSIKVSAFLDEYRQRDGENTRQLYVRTKSQMADLLKSRSAMKVYLAKHEQSCSAFINKLCEQVNLRFPKGCLAGTLYKRTVSPKTPVIKPNGYDNYYSPSLEYSYYWNLLVNNCGIFSDQCLKRDFDLTDDAYEHSVDQLDFTDSSMLGEIPFSNVDHLYDSFDGSGCGDF
ncbi:MAG: hypothetical protein COA42_13625 [Alteromonadaceae bacterium]|nr:MAG: hypothetical protein COA42_13625 [Alteromonadaceae bacterium]